MEGWPEKTSSLCSALSTPPTRHSPPLLRLLFPPRPHPPVERQASNRQEGNICGTRPSHVGTVPPLPVQEDLTASPYPVSTVPLGSTLRRWRQHGLTRHSPLLLRLLLPPRPRPPLSLGLTRRHRSGCPPLHLVPLLALILLPPRPSPPPRSPHARPRRHSYTPQAPPPQSTLLTKPHTGKEKPRPSIVTEGSNPCVTK